MFGWASSSGCNNKRFMVHFEKKNAFFAASSLHHEQFPCLIHSHSCPEKLLSVFIQRQLPSLEAVLKQSWPCWNFVLHLNLDFKAGACREPAPTFCLYLTSRYTLRILIFPFIYSIFLPSHCCFWMFWILIRFYVYSNSRSVSTKLHKITQKLLESLDLSAEL